MAIQQVDITKAGSKAKIVVNDTGVTSVYYPNLYDVTLSYDSVRNVVNVTFIVSLYNYSLQAIPKANFTIGGITITSQSIFDTQLSTIFPLSDNTGNIDTSAIVSLAAAAAGGNSVDQINASGKGVQLAVDITAITGTTPTITVTIQGKDTASGKYYNILVSPALSAIGTTLLTVYPGITNAANSASSTPLPRTWRILYTIGGTTPAVTATIGASVIV